MRKIILAVIAVSLLRGISFCATLGDMRTDVRYYINDTTATSHNNRYTDAFLNYRINQTANEIARAVFPIYTSKLITAVTSQQEYTVSTDTAKIDKVVFKISASTSTDSYRKLTFSTIQQLDKDAGDMWEQLADGLPKFYYIRANTIGLVPAPSGTYSIANAIKIYYYKMPSEMSADSDVPFDGQYNLTDYHGLIVLGTVIKCKKDKGMAWENEQTIYNVWLARMQNDINTTRPDSSVITVIK